MLSKTQKGKRGFAKLGAQDTWNGMFSLQHVSFLREDSTVEAVGEKMGLRPCADSAVSHPGARTAKAKSTGPLHPNP